MAQVVRKRDASVWNRLKSTIKTLDGLELKVGWFSTTRYEDGTPVAYVATIHEFGSSKANIPPRPFMRPTVAREEENWRRLIAQEAPKILDGTQSVESLFEMLGLSISGSIALTISEVTQPELEKSTVRAKMRKMGDQATEGALAKPLVETGLLMNSVTYTVGKNS